jgi:DNA invertase Pin-like site-specific DNA recombinase
MAKNDSDLFDRLRRAGVRKQVAKTLSEIGEGASKKAVRAARSAVGELRSLAEEIERRLPSVTPEASAANKTTGRTSARSRAATPRASRSHAASANAGGRGQRPVAQRKSASAPARTTATGSAASGARAPRGQNKAKILESLKAGSRTASEIAKETGIGTATVGSTLSKLATAGEVVKADRGYGLPAASDTVAAGTEGSAS